MFRLLGICCPLQEPEKQFKRKFEEASNMSLPPNHVSQPNLNIKSLWLPLIREELKKNPYPPKMGGPSIRIPQHLRIAKHKYPRCKAPNSDCLKSCACVLCTSFQVPEDGSTSLTVETSKKVTLIFILTMENVRDLASHYHPSCKTFKCKRISHICNSTLSASVEHVGFRTDHTSYINFKYNIVHYTKAQNLNEGSAEVISKRYSFWVPLSWS